jgi:hypothetical protein
VVAGWVHVDVAGVAPILSLEAAVWWVIVGLSVLTDLLYVPVALSLYLVLKGVNRNAMLIATAFVGLFIVLARRSPVRRPLTAATALFTLLP